MRYAIAIFALGLSACSSPALMANQDGGIIRPVNPWNQAQASDLAARHCAMSGKSFWINSLNSIYGELSFDCRSP